MSGGTREVVRGLCRGRAVAALGTVEGGHPYVSMVPFAVADDGPAVVVHVSRLAAHTGNMRRDGRVSLLVTEPESPDRPPQGLARVTLQGRAREVPPGDPAHAAARAAYLGRFPDAAPLFDLADFALFRIDVQSARVVGGFAQAATLTPEAFHAAVSGPTA